MSDISTLQELGWEPTIPVEQNVAEYVAWIKEQRGTREYLEEAERVMREQGVVRRVMGRQGETRGDKGRQGETRRDKERR